MRAAFTLVALLSVTGRLAVAQDAPAIGRTLTLDEAIAIALQNNPAYLQSVNTGRNADANVRSAYGALLPTSSASFSTRYSQSGSQFFNGVALSSNSNTIQSSYNLGVGYSINAASLLAPKAARANRDATEAEIRGGAEALRSAVTERYLVALQAEARAAVADSLVMTARAQLDLAKARVEAGAANLLDVRRAEVALGQAEITSLTNHNTTQVEKLRLFQQLGVAVVDTAVALTTKFDVSLPRFTRDSVLALARSVNPAVNALRSRLRAADVDLQVSRSQYTPTLSLGTGWGGQSSQFTDPEFRVNQARAGLANDFAGCMELDSIRTRISLPSLNCVNTPLSEEQAQAIRNANDQFPFKFTRAPFGLSASLSIPVFDGFRREQRLQTSDIARQDMRYALRARELQLNTEVTQAYLNLTTSYRVVALQETNNARAREELSFAEERYRVGAATFLDVIVSRSNFAQAQIDRVNAIYDYHRAFATLEAAVGRPLR
jgi:outer membrane protein